MLLQCSFQWLFISRNATMSFCIAFTSWRCYSSFVVCLLNCSWIQCLYLQINWLVNSFPGYGIKRMFFWVETSQIIYLKIIVKWDAIHSHHGEVYLSSFEGVALDFFRFALSSFWINTFFLHYWIFWNFF